tara:strand:+ start:848 stop:3439 length:2592 start_codon:yes stop_codon:yes gene_type:complete
MAKNVLNRPMFSQGNQKLPGYFGGGIKFKPKVKGVDLNPQEILEKFGLQGLEWLQRKIYGGSYIPDSWAQRALNQKKKELEVNYGKGAAENTFSDIETRTKIDPKELNTKNYSANNLVDALKWGNEGWINPLGYIPKVGPLPFRPLRTKETLGGAVKEIGGKGLKLATAYGGANWAKDAIKSDEVKAQEKTQKELQEKNINPAWADENLPVKTMKNTVLEDLSNIEMGDKSIMDNDYQTGNATVNEEFDTSETNKNVIDSADVVDSKAALSAGSNNVEDFNTPISENEAESGDVVNLKQYKEEFDAEKKKDKKIEDEGIIHSPHRDNVNYNAQLAKGLMDVDSSDMSEIANYIGFLKSIMGKRDPMVSAGLLLKLGTSLMNAPTTERGLSGFLQAAGQAGAEIAPELMKLGSMNEQQKQSLAAAALQMYMDKIKEGKPSGAPYMISEIDWQTNEAGNPYAAGVKSVRQVQLNSDDFRSAMAEDNAYFDQFNRPKYYFGSPGDPNTGAMFGSVIGTGDDAGAQLTESSKDAFKQTGTYMNDILDIQVPFLTTLLDYPHLLGASGALAEKGLGVTSSFSDVMEVLQGEFPDWESTMSKSLYAMADDFEKEFGLTARDPNSTMDMGGQKIPVFIDWNNDLEMNGGGMTSASHDMRLVSEKGIRSYMVKDGFDKFFNAEVIGSMDLISRTIGTGYARSRQPTGRMLADVLQGSLEDAKFTGFGTSQKASRVGVLSAHMRIINEMYEKISTAYGNAGITNDPDKVNPQSKKYTQGLRYIQEFDGGKRKDGTHMWNIKGLKQYANKYYGLKETILPDLPSLTFYSYEDWKNDGEIQVQNSVIQSDNKQSNTVDNIKNKFNDTLNNLIGN